MQKPYKETAVANILKEELNYYNRNGDGLKYKDFLIKQMSAQLAERIMTVLSHEGEVVARLSDLSVKEDIPTYSVEYSRQIEWRPLVRCKDCKHRPYEDEDGDVYAPDWGDYTCPFLCEDSYYNGMPEDDFFCKRGERKE